MLFDSCWDPFPKLGPLNIRRFPVCTIRAGYRARGRQFLQNPAEYPRLKAYVQGVVGAFAGMIREYWAGIFGMSRTT